MNNNIAKFYDNKSKIYNLTLSSGSLYEVIYNLIGEHEKILDVGCANGNFARELKKKNARITGVELSPVMAKNASTILDKVIIGNIETVKFPFHKKSFDTILLMDVLEHLFDPKGVLLRLNPYIKDNGKIIVSLPNVANWEVRLDLLRGKFNSERTTILEEGHIRFFTFDTAKKMFSRAGLKINHFDLVINYPLIILKIHNRFPHLRIDKILKKYVPKLFAFQFVFELKKK